MNQLEESVRYCNRPEKVITGENKLFVLHTEGSVTFKESILDRFGLRFSLQVDEYSAVVSISIELLEKLREILRRYIETSELRSYINQISSISLANFSRLDPNLEESLSTSQGNIFVEIDMLPNLGEEQYALLMRKLTEFLKERGEEVDSSRVTESSASLRTHLKPQTVIMIAQGVDSVWQTRKAPQIIIGKPQSMKIREEPAPKPPDADARAICVVDTGVDADQPFLRQVILDAVDLTPDDSSQDLDGHGTFVAGLAAYGDLENRRDPKATARIISAKVLENVPVPGEYLESRIEQAVRRFHEQARIFSMSVMYTECCSVVQPSELGYTIDKLSRDHNVLFAVCTGNVQDELPSLMNTVPYPTYFGEESCRIYRGAEACASVTVGGVAHKDSDTSIARIGEPSPFTRRGELRERGKPDVVSFAGNIERSTQTGGLQTNNAALGVTSLGLSPNTLAYDIGTSCAAPIVANLLARLSKQYPDADNNLLKALLVHFALWPDTHFRLNASDDLKKALYGKGVPDFYRCAYSTVSSATYIAEDSIGFNEIAWVPIYVPHVMRDIYGEKRMRVTLVYNPPVDKGVLGYTLLDLDFRLYKPYKTEYRVQGNWARFYRRQWDNVKTDVFRWQKGGWGREWSLMIFPKLRFRNRVPHLKDEIAQKFGVVVTLEDPNRRTNIYDAIMDETKMMIKPLEAYVQAKPQTR